MSDPGEARSAAEGKSPSSKGTQATTRPDPVEALRSRAGWPESGKLEPQGAASFAGMETYILIDGEASGGALCVLEMHIGPGGGAPDHISRLEDKLFIVQRGSVSFRVDGEALVASQGDRISVPRGRMHGFQAGPGGGAVMILIASPAGHDGFFRAMSELPVPHDPDRVRKVCERFGQQIIGL